jgi:His/Glu/Gln/Arg/opine family amino acid ABC transporter permease subunit
MNIDFSVVWKYVPFLIQGAEMTVLLTVLSQAIGTALGFAMALGRTSSIAWLRWLIGIYVWVIRGTPLLLHLFFVYYAAPLIGITLDAFPAAIIAMSASSAAYNCEILRSGIQAIHRGQIEAAQAIGLGYGKIVRYIIVPQAARIVIPPYMSNFISHTKNSSLASVITVQELMLTAQIIYSSTYRAVEVLTVTGAIYLLMTSCLTGLQIFFEYYTTYEKRGLSLWRRRRLLSDVAA